MIIQYIQSVESQQIADAIHYQRMVAQYNSFVWNGDFNNVPENKATPQRIKEIWVASKLFLDCTISEAINQYSLVSFLNGKPYIRYDAENKLIGGTKGFDEPKTIEEKDINDVVTNTYPNCINVPEEGLDVYDLSSFNYNIIDVNYL